MMVEPKAVGFGRLHKQAVMERAVAGIPFYDHSASEADDVGRIVPGRAFPEGPVEKLGARVVAVGIVVEKIIGRELAHGDDETIHVDFIRKLVRAFLDLLLLSPQADHLANKEPGGVVMQVGETGLNGLAVRESRGTESVAESIALETLRIVEDFRSGPKPSPEEKR